MLGAMAAGGRDRGLWLRAALVAATAGAAAGAAGWLGTDHLERDNDFCTSCHLSPELPLHVEIRRDFDRSGPLSLAALHAGAQVEARADSAFRCIDCHGGGSPLGKLRVKALAAVDAFWYLVGRFDEPTHMAWPLWDEDCRQCHPGFDPSPRPEWVEPDFHDRLVHNVDLAVACVECHTSHETGGNPDAYFLHPARVRRQCARCHSEFEEREAFDEEEEEGA